MKHFHQLLLTGALLLCAPTLLACACKGKASVKEARKNADVVLVGKVISEETIQIMRLSEFTTFPIHVKRYMVEVEATFKRGRTRKGDTVVVYTGMGHGDCGFHFVVGERYVIYGDDDDARASRFYGDKPLTGRGIYWTNICIRTRAFDEGEVRELGGLD